MINNTLIGSSPFEIKETKTKILDDFPATMVYSIFHWATPIETMETEIVEDESWFWTEEWQAKEKRADDDFESGRFQKFKNIDDLISYLDDQAE